MRSPGFLLCDPAGNVGDLTPPGEEWVPSPIQCLDRAVERKPEIVIVRFDRTQSGNCGDLVELCAALKRNSHTRGCPVLALLC